LSRRSHARKASTRSVAKADGWAGQPPALAAPKLAERRREGSPAAENSPSQWTGQPGSLSAVRLHVATNWAAWRTRPSTSRPTRGRQDQRSHGHTWTHGPQRD